MKGQVKICYFHTKIEQEQLYDKTGQKRRKFTHLLCLQIIVYNQKRIGYTRHISPLMFDVIDDKPEGFIMYRHEPVGRGFIHYHIKYERVYVL